MLNKKFIIGVLVFFVAVYFWNIHLLRFFVSDERVVYEIKKGSGVRKIAADLEEKNIVGNRWFFVLQAFVSGDFRNLKAGRYNLSPSMSVAEIVRKMASGNTLKKKITIIEGWTAAEIGDEAERANYFSKQDFLDSIKKDWSGEFDFLDGKPKSLTIEGYIFPDTYEITENGSADDFLRSALSNFGRKLTLELREKISRQGKSIFQIVTMASMLEKEVGSEEDKKIVAGILWKRLEAGMPLQVDATVNYITGKKSARTTSGDTKVESLYNTYKYPGLPVGPISNPGMDSVLAAIESIETDYWYYLSADGTGETIFSKTLEEHNIAKSKYLKNY